MPDMAVIRSFAMRGWTMGFDLGSRMTGLVDSSKRTGADCGFLTISTIRISPFSHAAETYTQIEVG